MNNLLIAINYYFAMNQKNLDEIAIYLHPKVHFIGPMANLTGKNSVISAVKGFMTVFNRLTVKSACCSGDEVMLVYELDCPEPIGKTRASALFTFKDGLIIGYELFYDPRPFITKKETIFKQS